MENQKQNEVTREEIAARLVSEFGYSVRLANKVSEKLENMDDAIKGHFYEWWKTGNEGENFTVKGYTISKLRQEFGLNPIAAFSAIDWINRDLESAISTLRRYDTIKD